MTKSQVKLTLENLKELDMGVPSEMFDMELKRVLRDMEDRPTDNTPRRVSIHFVLKPEMDSRGRNLEQVAMQVKVDSSVPKQQTRVYRMAPKQDGSLAFNPELLDAPNDRSLYQQETGEVKETPQADDGKDAKKPK
jgi:hypothetical protein